ncbi:MAG: signal recognition particle protein [Clostridiales bacterium]|nr:signal recognition particle protein [Clostridiales bacterium]
MVFEGLSEKLQNTFKKLKGKGKLTEKDINEAMREVKLALLEADVSFKVVKQFIDNIKERAVGSEVLESLTPAQQVIKIVNDELTKLMGGTQSKLTFSPRGLTVILMAGLQGTGKTTTCGKLALYLKKMNKSPLLAACDVYRPAAVEQLKIVGEKVGVPVFSMPTGSKAEDIAENALREAQNKGYDVLIIDTSGRLHIDEQLMDELERIKERVKPHEILLVVDAMTGQDAVNAAQGFNEKLGIDGIIMTKLDGDTRGGAALSVKEVTGKPIKFIGVGEKSDALEPFYPDRMASRILGMGDMLSLIEKAQNSFDEKKAKELEKKMRTQDFNLEDFLEQLRQMKNMGSMNQILEMIPGINKKALAGVNVDDKELARIEAIICSMTKKERMDPSIINGSRRKRIAMGSGTSVSKVNSVLKQFEQTKKMMKQFSNMGKMKKKGKMGFPFM